MNNFRARVALALLVFFLAGGTLFFFLRDRGDENLARIAIGGISLKVEVADTALERERGLSGREGLGEDAGMLFVFENPGFWGFWMKDMHFPIDIIWIGDDGLVADIASNVSPESYPLVLAPSSEALYVLEVPAGFVEAEGISPGDAFEISRF